MDAVLAIIEAKKKNGGRITKAEVLEIVEAEADAASRMSSDDDTEIALEKKKLQ